MVAGGGRPGSLNRRERGRERGRERRWGEGAECMGMDIGDFYSMEWAERMWAYA
jgi:hypothetical protein